MFPLKRQAVLPSGGKPDILALDKTGRPVVVEVKRSVERTQLSQALEYAGWARDTSLDELAGLFESGSDAFFQQWQEFTESGSPVVVNPQVRVLLVARDVHPRTGDALRFLTDNNVPVRVVSVVVYQDERGKKLIDVKVLFGPHEPFASAAATGSSAGGAPAKTTYTVNGEPVRIVHLVNAGLIAPGTTIQLTSNSVTTQAEITEDGSIALKDQEFPFPTTAARQVVPYPVDGWVKWRIAETGATLADLRAEFLSGQPSNVG